MFDHILVPLDGSTLAECVLPHLVALAKLGSPRITLLSVMDPIGAATRSRPVDPFDWQVRKAETEAYLKGQAARLAEAKLNIQVETLEGRAAESIVDYVREHNVSLILLSSHGQSGLSGWNVSSVVQKIILRAHTSIMIVRAYQTAQADLSSLRYQRILLPLDGSQRAEIVLPVAETLARAHEATLLLAHVVRRPEMPRRTPHTDEDLELAERLIERNRAEASRYLGDLQTRLNAIMEQHLVVGENVADTLHKIVDQESVDLVLLSAHGYTGGSQWPYGSVVISFLVYGTSPLLVLQDMPRERIEATRAELAAREKGGR